MKPNYSDILARAGEPLWYDEHGVPRYVEFHPNRCVLLGAEEAFLVDVLCQGCGTPFLVALTWRDKSVYWLGKELPPSDRLTWTGGGGLHYGDPPNTGCCPAGPTMTSDFHRIAQAWIRTATDVWIRLDEDAVQGIGAVSEVGEWR